MDLEECPICFLHYPSLNRSKCCSKGICTECFLQMKSPHVSRPTQCPFCKTPNYAVEYRGAKTLEEKGVEQAEEQKVIEAKIRMRQQELQDEEGRSQGKYHDHWQQQRVASLPTPATTSVQALNIRRSETDGTRILDTVTVGGGFFASPAVAVGADSLWFRGGQRSEGTDSVGGLRQPLLAPSTLPSMQMLPSNALAGNGSAVAAVTDVVRNIAGIRGGGPTHAPLNRDDEFDLDLEDIMVMEAIWLSIQEQGPQRYSENVTGSVGFEAQTSSSHVTARNQDFRMGPNESFTGPTPPQNVDSSVPLQRISVTGGFAGAIAAFAERQVAGGVADGLASELVHQDEGYSQQSAGRIAGLEVEMDGEHSH